MRRALVLSIVLLAACESADPTPVDVANATYKVDQRTVTLVSGVFEEPAAPGSAAKATTRLHEKRAAGDLNADGRPDAAVVLTSSGSGSGTFWYVSVVLGTGAGKGTATNAVLLGDRIAIEAVKVDGGTVVVETLERRAGEPFTTVPSVKAVRTFQVKGGALTEVK